MKIHFIELMFKGLIIAFTSDFIPRLIYTLKYSPDHTLSGYVNYTLAYFDTADFPSSPSQPPLNSTTDGNICRFFSYLIFNNAMCGHLLITKWNC